MKAKKIIYGISVATLSTLMLTACSTTASNSNSSKSSSSSKAKTTQVVKKQKVGKQIAGAKLKDGTYKLVEDNYDHGYKVKMSMTVKGGKVTDATYDQVNKDGKSKTQDASYEKQMKKYSKVGPKEYIKKLRKEFLDNDGDMEKVQVVSGATESSNDFITYVSQLLNAAQKGNTKIIKVDNILYKE